MAQPVKYCLVSSYYYQDVVAASTGSGNTSLTGLYSWTKAFRGDAKFIPGVDKDIAEKYDIIHMNMTPGNMGVPLKLREILGKDSSTKIVMNVDYAYEMWQNNFKVLDVMFHELNRADMIFHVEPIGAKILEHNLKRKVHVIPHPADIKHIKARKKPPSELWFGTMHHRYDIGTAWISPYLAMKDIPNIQKVLLGVTPDIDVPSYEFDQVFQRVNFEEGLNFMSNCIVGCDPFSYHSYGRCVIEWAAMGIPVVGSERISAMHRLFPDLVVEPNDVSKMHTHFKNLYYHPDLAEELGAQAREKSEYYSLDNCRSMVLEALEIEDTGFPPHINEDFKDIYTKLTKNQWQEEYDDAMAYCLNSGLYPVVRHLDGRLVLPMLPQRTEWVMKQIPQDVDKKVLDLGCFQGVTLFHLLRRGFKDLSGLDVSRPAIEQAIKNLRVMQNANEADVVLSEHLNFQVGYAEDLASIYGEDVFDFIIAEEILEHVRDPKQVIAEISKVLKPGGNAIITTPIEDQVPSAYHIQSYDKKRIENLFSDCSIKATRIKSLPFFGIIMTKDAPEEPEKTSAEVEIQNTVVNM